MMFIYSMRPRFLKDGSDRANIDVDAGATPAPTATAVPVAVVL
jgi:hypothetical protein